MPPLSIRAHGSSLPLVLIERIAHVRAVGGLPSPSCQRHDTSPKGGGETWLSLRESQVGSPPEACRKPGLASPSGGGGLALARTERASCRPHHPLPWLSPLRARPPRSLVSFWLRAHKVKGKVEAFLKRKRVRPADVPQKTLISLRSAPGAHVRFSLAQARRSAAAQWRELPGVQPPRIARGATPAK